MKRKSFLSIGLAAGLVAGLCSAPAYAQTHDTAGKTLDALEQLSESAIQDGVHPLESNAGPEHGSNSSFNVNESEIQLPTSLDEELTLTGADGLEIGLTLPNDESGVMGTALENGMTVFDNGDGSTTVPTVKSDGSVQVNTVIDDASAPSEYEYKFSLPEGAQIEAYEGGAHFVSSDGEFLGGIAPAWAVDANGAKVPTRFEISGMTVTQIVEHEGFQYPVVADPMWGKDLIKSVNWISRSGVVSMSIVPTGWNRFNVGFQPAISAGWSEALSKTPTKTFKKKKYNRAKANTTRMYWQYRCHQVAAFTKSSWNLEPSKIRNTYLDYVRNLCN